MVHNMPRPIWLHPNKGVFIVGIALARMCHNGVWIRFKICRPVWSHRHPELFSDVLGRVCPKDEDYGPVRQDVGRRVVLDVVPSGGLRVGAVVVAENDSLLPRPVDNVLGVRHGDVAIWETGGLRVERDVRDGSATVDLIRRVVRADKEEQVVTIRSRTDDRRVVVEGWQHDLRLGVWPTGVGALADRADHHRVVLEEDERTLVLDLRCQQLPLTAGCVKYWPATP
mmetsp:Transcript_19584/g.50932  ORF Transcript_19584/g.50932 Transcript_19584/m.50932 type:complete len:226 (-) Transcript_19584:319-996(-)